MNSTSYISRCKLPLLSQRNLNTQREEEKTNVNEGPASIDKVKRRKPGRDTGEADSYRNSGEIDHNKMKTLYKSNERSKKTQHKEKDNFGI